MNTIDIYGEFSEYCDIIICGTYGNGFELEEVVENSFKNRREAIKSIRGWALRVGVQVDEISFND